MCVSYDRAGEKVALPNGPRSGSSGWLKQEFRTRQDMQTISRSDLSQPLDPLPRRGCRSDAPPAQSRLRRSSSMSHAARLDKSISSICLHVASGPLQPAGICCADLAARASAPRDLRSSLCSDQHAHGPLAAQRPLQARRSVPVARQADCRRCACHLPAKLPRRPSEALRSAGSTGPRNATRKALRVPQTLALPRLSGAAPRRSLQEYQRSAQRRSCSSFPAPARWPQTSRPFSHRSHSSAFCAAAEPTSANVTMGSTPPHPQDYKVLR